MKNVNPARQKLAALGIASIPLLTFPIVELPEGWFADFPATYVYLFGCWALLIGVAAWTAERQAK